MVTGAACAKAGKMHVAAIASDRVYGKRIDRLPFLQTFNLDMRGQESDTRFHFGDQGVVPRTTGRRAQPLPKTQRALPE